MLLTTLSMLWTKSNVLQLRCQAFHLSWPVKQKPSTQLGIQKALSRLGKSAAKIVLGAPRRYPNKRFLNESKVIRYHEMKTLAAVYSKPG